MAALAIDHFWCAAGAGLSPALPSAWSTSMLRTTPMNRAVRDVLALHAQGSAGLEPTLAGRQK